ncbi:magnesium transporter NIPA-domain-containing protein [Phyllosticta citriasiana]|uniref:magnesium transporter NIPA-domain-containing protein n=1 Tax=Phyllosticta citriasiana TaxID=595635 RepID=UPI0030FD4039
MVELSPGGSVALGVFVGLLSTSVQSLGLTLQRKSHLLEEEKHETDDRRPPYRRRRWQVGMLMFIVANLVGSTIQITTLPLPVLSTLQASGLVFNSICATLILSEPFTRFSLVGTILVAAGAVLIGIFGALTEPSHTLTQLLALLGRTQFLIWLVATFLICAGLFAAQWFLKRLVPRPTPLVRLLRGMAFGAISGILSAHSLLVAKSAVELLVRTIVDRENQFNRWQSYIILLGLVFLALTQLYYLHRGLKLCSTSVLYPFVFCIYNIIAILDGLIYFRQVSRLPVKDSILIAIGTVILLAGVAALSWRLEDKDPIASSHQRKLSRHSFTGVPPPRNALSPGLGFINAGGSDCDEGPFYGATPCDEEAPLGIASSSKKRKGSHAAGAVLDERTPLLIRTNTASSTAARNAASSQSPTQKESPHRPAPLGRMRRMTIAEEAGEVWDELNDRERRGSDVHSPIDARGRGRGRGHARIRSGTLPLSSQKGNQRKRRWWESIVYGGTSNRPAATSTPRPPLERAITDRDNDEPDATLLSPSPERSSFWQIRNPRTRISRQASGGPFRLNWWRSRSNADGERERNEQRGSGRGDRDNL